MSKFCLHVGRLSDEGYKMASISSGDLVDIDREKDLAEVIFRKCEASDAILSNSSLRRPYMKNRERIKFDFLRLVGVDQHERRICKAAFAVFGNSIEGQVPESIISLLGGTRAVEIGKQNAVPYGITKFWKKEITFSVKPNWAPGTRFAVSGSDRNNQIYTVVECKGEVVKVKEWVTVEDTRYGYLYDFEALSGPIYLFVNDKLKRSAFIGVDKNEQHGSLWHSVMVGQAKDGRLSNALTSVVTLNAPERMLNQIRNVILANQ